MRSVRRLGRGLVVLALLSMLCPQLAYGATPNTQSGNSSVGTGWTVPRDVALDTGGVLRGVVLDSAGQPAARQPVAVVQNGQTVAGTQTDAEGRFAVSGLRTGTYHVGTPYQIQTYRVWTAQVAPPAANREVLIVNGDDVIRGGMAGPGLAGFLANPWVLGGIVVAAIAIPLSLDDDDDFPTGS